MTIENTNIDEPECLAALCEIEGMKRTSLFRAVREAIASRLGYNGMDPEKQAILSQTNKKYEAVMESHTDKESAPIAVEEIDAAQSENTVEAANDENFDLPKAA